ncbi:LysM peptidoglycan-binding domain-containing protein [Floricoccus penangensis]|uniref:aggregation-promoting factor n=1 Tax=Floricoccus penangensis TaxID=1859475 RepID=UPI00203C1CF6|nr:LysM domain-containing protein [Floricoccus penangensis]URZ87462.1 LysM peptidoglycan-binding domain-containing protein [Floricoccus penangensis]
MNIKSILATGAVLGTAAFGATSANAETISHEIVSGDTLSSISQKYLGSADYVKTLASLNKIQDANLIYVGEVIKFDTDNLTVTFTNTNTNEEKTVSLQDAAPVAQEVTAPAVTEAPVAQAPVETTHTEQPAAPAQPTAPAKQEASYAGNSSSAKEWIAQKESSGSYSATNGRYIGRYQLDSSYLNGDYSPANQERVADAYVNGRYGSWEGALSFWQANGWY